MDGYNGTGVRVLDTLSDDARVKEIGRDRDPSGMATWEYWVTLQPGWSNEHGEHFVTATTAAELKREFARVIRPCVCEECKSDGK